ncbi:MAG: class I SAM-dependent methyltransferase, partial [bacterium]
PRPARQAPNQRKGFPLMQAVNARLKPIVPGPWRSWVKETLEAPLVAGDLTRLAQIYRTDKWRSGFTEVYPRWLASSRHRLRTVLEIGVGGGEKPHVGGGSLRMWKRYFPRAHIYGLDLYPKAIREPRITVFQGSQSDRELLQDVARRIGPIDLLIDDGSHRGRDIAISFQTLFPAVRPGGLYVIEDLQTSYWPTYEGGAPGTPGTGIALVQRLLDGLHHPFFQVERSVPSYTDLHVAAVHVYPAIAFIEKSRATPTTPDPSPSTGASPHERAN